MKNKDTCVHNLRLDFHMTQRTLAPVRFSDGLTGMKNCPRNYPRFPRDEILRHRNDAPKFPIGLLPRIVPTRITNRKVPAGARSNHSLKIYERNFREEKHNGGRS